MCQWASIGPLLPDMCVIHNAVEATKKEDRGEPWVVEGPGPRFNASPQQIGKIIDKDVVDEAFPRGRVRSVKENVVQPDGIKIPSQASPGPCSQLSRPVLRPFFFNCGLDLHQKLLPVAVAKCGKDMLLGGKIEVKRAFANVSGGSDL